jgi:hypothetical protein
MAVNVGNSALASRRFNRWLFVIASIVLIAGVVAVLVTFVGNTAKSENTAPTGPALPPPPPPQPNIKMPAAAWNVAKTFLFTALPRTDLATAWKVSDANVHGGLTFAQWKTGAIQPPYFPTAKVIRYNFKNTNYAHPNEIAQNLMLVPKKGSSARTQTYLIILKKFGRQWKVDYFNIVGGPPVPAP